MVDVVVTGIGLACAIGSREESWQQLLAGKSGIGLYRPFPELSPRPLGLISSTPTPLEAIAQQTVAAAIKDAGFVPPLSDCGVVVGSSRAFQGVWEEMLRERTIPNWLETLPHQGAIAAAKQIGVLGPVLAPMAACATGIWAIARGVELIQTGECQRVLAGAVESPVTPLTLAGFEKMGALAKTGCYPFDRGREGLVLGEGAALLVLESAASARDRNAKIYGRVLGFGLTADGYHVSAPDIAGKSSQLAIAQCLERSNLDFTEIDYIHAHGTSTRLNDRNEARLIEHLFPHGVAVSSTKGATGHTLGASGALGVAFCLMALQRQILPPCVGLREPEFELDLVVKARPARVRRVLCLSFGFGGQNAAIALSQL